MTGENKSPTDWLIDHLLGQGMTPEEAREHIARKRARMKGQSRE